MSNFVCEKLVEKHGVLINLQQLGGLLGRSPDGLRFTLRGSSELAQKLQAASVRIGRRRLFRTEQIARLIEEGADDAPRPSGALGRGRSA